MQAESTSETLARLQSRIDALRLQASLLEEQFDELTEAQGETE